MALTDPSPPARAAHERNSPLPAHLFQALFVFCVCYAIVSDFTRLTIPNWIP